jgi:hypothetical protein
MSFASFIRLTNYVVAIHPRYAARAFLAFVTSVASVPLRLWESLRYGNRIRRTRIEHPPVFVIGHWRSGTTHLHNLMSQDPALAYLSMYQAMVPNCSLVGERWLKPLLRWIVPPKRPMDNMVWPVDAPQEDEIPLAKLTPYSFYLRTLFPRRSSQLFRKYVLFEGAPASVAAELKRKYYRLLQVATLHAAGKRLVLKNPVNTARIRMLLDMFPDAKFIHAYRCPYDVFASTAHLYDHMLPITTLQVIHREENPEAILSLYEEMMRRFFTDRALIPRGNLVEVRFEDLEREPMRELRRIYDTLALPGWEQAEPACRAYVATQRTYLKNRHGLPADHRQLVDERWGFAFAELGYRRESTVTSS